MTEMFDTEMDTKHVRIRGSLALKYPAPADACRVSCEEGDDNSRSHRCVLAIGHEDEHQWSWACMEMKARMV